MRIVREIIVTVASVVLLAILGGFFIILPLSIAIGVGVL